MRRAQSRSPSTIKETQQQQNTKTRNKLSKLEVIPPTPEKQLTKNQTTTIISANQTQNKQLDISQANVLKQLVTLEQSNLYHESKSKEFTRHTTKDKQPNFTYPQTEVSYTNNFSSEMHEKYKNLKRQFQIDMCELLRTTRKKPKRPPQMLKAFWFGQKWLTKKHLS